MTRSPVVLAPGDGRIYSMGRISAIFKADDTETDSRYSISEWWLEPHTMGPGPHAHPEDDVFYVLEGTMSILIDGHWREVEPGTMVFAPKMSVHSLKNVGDTPARVLFSALPSGFDIFFSRCEKEFQKPGGPDMARITEIAIEHGIHFV